MDELKVQKNLNKELNEQIHVQEQQEQQVPQAELLQQQQQDNLVAQPVNVEQAAEAPVMVEPIQQQEVSLKERLAEKSRKRKEKRAEHKAQKAHAKAEKRLAPKLAKAKLQIDQAYQAFTNTDEYKEYAQQPGTYTQGCNGLLMLMLDHLHDKEKALPVLKELNEFNLYSASIAQMDRTFRIRQHLTATIRRTQNGADMNAITMQLSRERGDYNSIQKDVDERYTYLEKTVKNYVGEEKFDQEIKHFDTYKDRMQEKLDALKEAEPNMDVHQLRRAVIRDYMVSPTLKNLEATRRAAIASESYKMQMENGYNIFRTVNAALHKKGRNRLQLPEMEQLIRDYLEEPVKNMHYQLRVPNCNIMSKILDSGRFKTQLEAETFGAIKDNEARMEYTRDHYGVEIEGEHALTPEKYEIYGYGSNGNMITENDMNSYVGQQMAQYGQVVVTLKKSRMLDRTTHSVGDSLTNHVNAYPGMVGQEDIALVGGISREPLVLAAYRHKQNQAAGIQTPYDINDVVEQAEAPYLELQFHDGVTVADIEKVTLLTDYHLQEKEDKGFVPDQDIPQELVDRLHDLNIKVTRVRGNQEDEL